MNFGNLYTRLRLTAAATQAEIKTAYYRLSKIYHPDTNTNSSKAGPQFRGITEAYKVLGNPKTRAEYDKGINKCMHFVFYKIQNNLILFIKFP